jgi:DNA-binding MarR family transcriptional regulator
MSKDTKAEVIDEIGELARISQLTTDLFDDAVCEALGVNRTDLRVLDSLERIGPMTAGKLAEVTGLSPGAMTAAIDRLEKAGHARRVPDATDRRRITVEITPAARERAWELYGPLKRAYDGAISGFTLAELETIRDYWKRSLAAGEAQLVRLEGEADTGAPRSALRSIPLASEAMATRRQAR